MSLACINLLGTMITEVCTTIKTGVERGAHHSGKQRRIDAQRLMRGFAAVPPVGTDISWIKKTPNTTGDYHYLASMAGYLCPSGYT